MKHLELTVYEKQVRVETPGKGVFRVYEIMEDGDLRYINYFVRRDGGLAFDPWGELGKDAFSNEIFMFDDAAMCAVQKRYTWDGLHRLLS